MLWEELTAQDFKAGIEKSSGVCILPIGVLEKHGDHLPLGMAMYSVTAIAKKAAELSTAIVFPYYFFFFFSEAKHESGCLAPSHRLIMDALHEMCDEIHRNGFKKILILSGHGGNSFFLPFFAQMFPGLNRPYAVYAHYANSINEEQHKIIEERSGVADMGSHGGFLETSILMYLRPELVYMDRVKVQESVSMERLKDLENNSIYTGFNWYAKYPHHFAGDPSAASPEHGEFIFDMLIKKTVNVIDAVKADNVSLKLIEEYNSLAN
jgi:creatinine amidohydrolase